MANRNKKTQKKYEDSKKSRTPKNDKRYSEKDTKDKSFKDEKVPSKEPWNKAEWYIPDSKIREQVASFAVNTTTGIPEIIEGVNAELSYNVQNQVLYGDIMSIALFPYPGVNGLTNFGSGVSALDTACRKLYTAISSVNSKTTQYTPESLGIAIIAIGELISLLSYAQRAYGVAFTYNPRNRHVPERIIKAMGLTSSIFDDLPNYRMQLNKLITAANNIRMLNDIKYFTKCWEIYANYFEDASSGLAQYYVMRPAGYLKYVETSPTTGELEWVAFPTPVGTMSHTQLINHIYTCLNNLLTSSLMNYVYTDIVNYVTREGGKLMGFDYIGELYTVLPLQDNTFLTQIHNMTWGMFDLTTTTYKVFEDPLTLTIKTTDIFNHTTDANDRLALATDRIIDFPFTDNPTVDDKVDAIAYTTIVWDIDSTGNPTGIAAPDHPVLTVDVLRNDAYILVGDQTFDLTTGTTSQLVTYLMCMDSFHIAPLLYAYSYSSSNQAVYPLGSLNYFTRLRFNQLKNIQDYSFLGLFDAEVKSVTPF